jgi:ABC-type polysaccharide/polyol phosphate export permease
VLLFFDVSLIGIIYYLFILIFFCLFIFGLSAILVSLTVYFVDLDNIWNFGVRILWFATPIFYSIDNQIRLFYLNLFNPIYYFITIAREIIIYNIFPAPMVIWGIVGYGLMFFSVGLFLFNKLKNKFAEMI